MWHDLNTIAEHRTLDFTRFLEFALRYRDLYGIDCDSNQVSTFHVDDLVRDFKISENLRLEKLKNENSNISTDIKYRIEIKDPMQDFRWCKMIEVVNVDSVEFVKEILKIYKHNEPNETFRIVEMVTTTKEIE